MWCDGRVVWCEVAKCNLQQIKEKSTRCEIRFLARGSLSQALSQWSHTAKKPRDGLDQSSRGTSGAELRAAQFFSVHRYVFVWPSSFACSPEGGRLHVASHDHDHLGRQLHVRLKAQVPPRRRLKHEAKVCQTGAKQDSSKRAEWGKDQKCVDDGRRE